MIFVDDFYMNASQDQKLCVVCGEYLFGRSAKIHLSPLPINVLQKIGSSNCDLCAGIRQRRCFPFKSIFKFNVDVNHGRRVSTTHLTDTYSSHEFILWIFGTTNRSEVSNFSAFTTICVFSRTSTVRCQVSRESTVWAPCSFLR